VRTGIVLVAVLVACSSEEDRREKQRECDAIADDIRTTATQRGLNTQGVCSNTNPSVQQDFGPKCRDLKRCNDELDAL
jgi:hypothetical protein